MVSFCMIIKAKVKFAGFVQFGVDKKWLTVYFTQFQRV